MKLKKILILLVIIELILIGSLLAYVFADRGNPGGIGLKPTNPNTENPYWFIYEAKPGEKISDSLIIKNYENTPVEITLRFADATEEATLKDFTLKTNDDTQEHIGSWGGMLSESIITLGPKEETTVNFEIDIPENTSHKEYYGALFGSYVVPHEEGTQLVTVLETGARILLTVTDTPRTIEHYDKWIGRNKVPEYLLYSGIITIGALIFIVIAQQPSLFKKL